MSHNKLGISLRGSCTSADNVAQLAQATRHLLTRGQPQAWVDCRRLNCLTWLGQRALMEADRNCREAGITLYWCGFPPYLLNQLKAAGLEQVMRLVPASLFAGPSFLLAN